MRKSNFLYYMHDGATVFRLELSRDLSLDGVRDLEQAWATASSMIGGRCLVVDLSYLASLDKAGRELLEKWHAQGARFVAISSEARERIEVKLTDKIAMGRRKLFTREDVLNKTIPVFWKHGFAETSVQDLEQATGVHKSGLYAEFKDKEDLFVASIRQCFDMLTARETLTKQPLGWNNVEGFLKVCYGGWGQKGCFSVNSMREFADLPPKARQIIIANMTKAISS